MDTGTWGLYYNYTWWGNAIQTAPSVIGKPDFFGSQFEMLTSQQPNQVVNGDFSNGDTDWTLVGTTTIGNGVCTFRDTGNTNSQLIQTGITANKTYKLVFDVTRYVSGRIQLIFGGGSTVNVDISGGVGTYTAYVLAGSSTNWLIKRDGGYPNYDFSIDNVSVQLVRADNVEAVKCLADWIHETQILDV